MTLKVEKISTMNRSAGHEVKEVSRILRVTGPSRALFATQDFFVTCSTQRSTSFAPISVLKIAFSQTHRYLCFLLVAVLKKVFCAGASLRIRKILVVSVNEIYELLYRAIQNFKLNTNMKTVWSNSLN